MTRNAPTILALLLLVATATAFAVTQRLKLEPSPISQTRVTKVFSPVCRCASDVATIQFNLERADHLRIAVHVDGREAVVADREFPEGHVRVNWNGAGVADGTYHPVVHLLREQRTIELANPIRLDSVRPTVTFLGLSTSGNKTLFRYRSSEPAHGLLFVDGHRRVFTYSTRRNGRLPYYGKLKKTTRLVLAVQDAAGNRSAPVRIR